MTRSGWTSANSGPDYRAGGPVTLAGFISARLDEIEAAATAAGGREWHVDKWPMAGDRVEDDTGDVIVYDEGSPTSEQAAHIALHDPARVLREVAAKRAILAAYTDPGYCSPEPMYFIALSEALEALAAVWSDHPDYQEEWP